ncbi:pseudoazurin [Rhizorhabdus wittichii RW1]|uniref:Pseudoazurin n=1 Tax=Rhizorhabdus wittichii (strain DSM 6014 / CCUG 31198 / JCM 15750 / NBRC 105917 / EY 4224 / RW1) TaxID=392499 RepID=A0A9J9H8T2_RHIWR|nr:pseudoazurin [Rhizorhabdus wittichii RW1]
MTRGEQRGVRMVRFAPVSIAALALLAAPLPAHARDIVVHMKNMGKDGAMVFEPAFIKAKVGDRIVFTPTDPSHNAETLPAMLPAGATPMKGALNKEVAMTVSAPGLYGIKCMPHYSMGMVALVQVGQPAAADLVAAKAVKLPPLAAKRMTALLARVR